MRLLGGNVATAVSNCLLAVGLLYAVQSGLYGAQDAAALGALPFLGLGFGRDLFRFALSSAITAECARCPRTPAEKSSAALFSRSPLARLRSWRLV